MLLAKNSVGFRNLSKLVSAGFTEGFYYKPRVDKELLRENSEGIIALTACLGGEVQARLLSGNIDAAERIARDYQSIFGEDFYLEIQDQGFEAERLIIPSQYRAVPAHRASPWWPPTTPTTSTTRTPTCTTPCCASAPSASRASPSACASPPTSST